MFAGRVPIASPPGAKVTDVPKSVTVVLAVGIAMNVLGDGDALSYSEPRALDLRKQLVQCFAFLALSADLRTYVSNRVKGR